MRLYDITKLCWISEVISRFLQTIPISNTSSTQITDAPLAEFVFSSSDLQDEDVNLKGRFDHTQQMDCHLFLGRGRGIYLKTSGVLFCVNFCLSICGAKFELMLMFWLFCFSLLIFKLGTGSFNLASLLFFLYHSHVENMIDDNNVLDTPSSSKNLASTYNESVFVNGWHSHLSFFHHRDSISNIDGGLRRQLHFHVSVDAQATI